jgi:hypothetical protein
MMEVGGEEDELELAEFDAHRERAVDRADLLVWLMRVSGAMVVTRGVKASRAVAFAHRRIILARASEVNEREYRIWRRESTESPRVRVG